MPYCPECGEEVGERGNFCPKCGNRIAQGPSKSRRATRSRLNSKIFVGIIVAIIAIAGIWVLYENEGSATNYAKLFPADTEKLLVQSGDWIKADKTHNIMIPSEINENDVQEAASGYVTVYKGSSKLREDFREFIENIDFDEGHHRGIEVWKNGEGYWVAFMNDKIIHEEKQRVKQFISVEKGEKSFFSAHREVRTLIGELKYKDFVSIDIQTDQYRDLKAKSSCAKLLADDSEEQKGQRIYLFNDENAAEDAIDKIRDKLKDQGEIEDLKIQRNGKIVDALYRRR